MALATSSNANIFAEFSPVYSLCILCLMFFGWVDVCGLYCGAVGGKVCGLNCGGW